MLLDKRHIHFVGIGGIGMSAVGYILLGRGCKVSGSDTKPNNLTKKLERLGAKIFEGHRSSNISRSVDLVVYSSAASVENPEIVEAKRRKIPVVQRARVLAELLSKKKAVAVTGTHGKTTTTSLISVMLEKCGLEPTVAIGGEVEEFSGNAKVGKGRFFVAEADESDGSFLHLKPLYAVITNIEAEHLDYYRTLGDMIKAYGSFAGNVARGGAIIYNIHDGNIRKALAHCRKVKTSFGFLKTADIYPVDVRMDGFCTTFGCVYRGKFLGKVSLRIPGRHNILNALAAILLGLRIGLKFEQIASAIKDFTGTKRRFHLRAQVDDIMLIDDYGHHPTEIRAVLDACRNWKDRRLIAVFQPHRYTRTKLLADEFGRCFFGVDKLILTDIYAASEKPIDGVSVRTIHDKVCANGVRDAVMMKKELIAEYLMKIKKPGDMIVVLGAGDIKDVADELALKLKRYGETLDRCRKLKVGNIVKGAVKTQELLKCHTSFRIGGPADMWVEPKNTRELKNLLLHARKEKTPVFVIGGGSNVLASDKGFRGIVVHLGAPSFRKAVIRGTKVNVGAGAAVSGLVRQTCAKGLGGMESLVGIPGTVGGAIRMNAGGWKSSLYKNIGDLVTSLKVMGYDGELKTLSKKDLVFGYRSSNLDDYIILEAELMLHKDDARSLNARCAQFLTMKRQKQALDVPSAGCVFKNPNDFQFTCGQMIDMLGLKGKCIGGAEISEKHANFIVNKTRQASCKDVMDLIEFIKDKVSDNYHIPLELEIKLL